MRGAFARALAKVPARRRVYVDETGLTTGMARLYGRAPPGRRVRDAAPQEGWRVVTLVAALRSDGPTPAALAFDGPTDAAAFACYVERALCPTLRRGDVVIMDRLGAHRPAGVRAAIATAGGRLMYLPPYSPDLSPIEPCWSEVKQHVRAARPRTRRALITSIGAGLRSVTAADARGFFRHCRYEVH